MPGTPAAVLIFILLIIPGITYVLRKDALNPTEEKSAFRDTASMALVSIIVSSIVISIVMLIALWFPQIKNAMDSLSRDPKEFILDNYAQLWWWFIGLMFTACFIAFIMGDIDRWISRKRVLWRWNPGPYDASSSVWARVFRQHNNLKPEARVKYFVECLMEDGPYYRGICEIYNPGLDETADRDILLQSPLEYKPADSDDFIKLQNSTQVIISARKISSLHVTMMPYEQPVTLASDIEDLHGQEEARQPEMKTKGGFISRFTTAIRR